MNAALAHWLITIFLLLWGCAYAGLVAFSFLFATPEHWQRLVSEGRISDAYVQYIAAIPTWAVAATFLAAISRLLGAVALAFSNALAYPIYGLSLLFVAIIMFRGFVFADVTSVISRDQIVLEGVFLLFSLLAVVYSRYGQQSGLLH